MLCAQSHSSFSSNSFSIIFSNASQVEVMQIYILFSSEDAQLRLWLCDHDHESSRKSTLYNIFKSNRTTLSFTFHCFMWLLEYYNTSQPSVFLYFFLLLIRRAIYVQSHWSCVWALKESFWHLWCKYLETHFLLSICCFYILLLN